MANHPIKRALISVYHKENLDLLCRELLARDVELYSTGGTYSYLVNLGAPVREVSALTGFPEILGGRVKTLHPRVFGGILARREEAGDVAQLEEHEIVPFDLVVVDLYPFRETLAAGGTHQEIIEKIDIGGIALIRAAAKNYRHVAIVSSRRQYVQVAEWLREQNGALSEDQRRLLAGEAFAESSSYDSSIGQWVRGSQPGLVLNEQQAMTLRYGENPHQKAAFYGAFNDLFSQLHGKELSYNNLLDVDAAINLMHEFANDRPTAAILKHNNACGLASRDTLSQAYADALAGDPVSAFGGVVIFNREVDTLTAAALNELFCEVVIAPGYAPEAQSQLMSKKNRILLVQHGFRRPRQHIRAALNGYLVQDFDDSTELRAQFRVVTNSEPNEQTLTDLEFALRVVKHTRSNAIVLAKGGQLLASGTGQTSRVDALRQAIHKAKSFNFSLNGAVMASDAFFPFPDCVEIAAEAGIKAVVQPGGSIKDQLSIDACNQLGLSMVFTGVRHFKH